MSEYLEESQGYQSLLEAVEGDCGRNKDHDYMGKFQWVLDRARHYAERTGLTATEILNAWESRRDSWYMNHYQEMYQPKLTGGTVRVFDTTDDLLSSIGDGGFRCPNCGSISKCPYECDSGNLVVLMNSKSGAPEPCNWKSYGLFGSLGKGVSVFVKDKIRVENIFMPVAWESDPVAVTEEEGAIS